MSAMQRGLIGLAVGVSVVLGAALGVWAPVAWADHGGPITYVDIKNPPEEDQDCNFHFRTLKAALTNCPLPEHGIIIVDPGVYDEGKLEVNVKGLVIKSSGGAQRTKINGCFVLGAKQAELVGFDINAKDQADCENGITVANREVKVLDNIVHEAKANGIEILENSDGSTIQGNNVFNNSGIGIHARGESHSLQITDNRVQSNGASGIVLEGGSDRFLLSNNQVSLNLGTGILVLGSDGGQLTDNVLRGNQLEGIKLDKSNGNVIVSNTAESNGLFGISLVGSDNNEVRGNTLVANRAGGVALRGNAVPAQRNTVESNEIRDSTQSGASGVMLEGSVSGSIVLKNTIVGNSIGVRLTRSEVTEGEPSNNTIDSNEIRGSDEDGVRIEASFGLNLFRSNQIVENNRIGIHVMGGSGNDTFAENLIESNGDDGIRITDSERNTIQDNEITLNGGGNNDGGEADGGGIVLIRAHRTTVRKNSLHDGEANGILIIESNNVRLLENTVERHQQDGVKGLKPETLLFDGNVIQDNRERGVALYDCKLPDLQRNVIASNTLGGVFLKNCEGPHLQMNEITDNARYGLWTEGSSDVQARRNWWGDPKGPAGIFEGRGNAVIMIGVEGGNSFPLEQDQILQSVLPWLTDRVAELSEPSVRGFLLHDLGPGKVELDAMDRADVRLSLFSVGKEERGVAIVARYRNPLPTEGSIYAVAPLANAIKSMSVLVSGFGTGTATLEVEYSDDELPEGVDRATLRLFYWDAAGGQWVQLPGKSLNGVGLVEGEIEVEKLREGAVIALAPGA